jgi:ribosomal protein S18 acetylase RimI-like enzyme
MDRNDYISVREAKETDLPMIQTLTRELIKTMSNTKGINVQLALDNCKHLIHDPYSYFFVAVMNKTIIGFITVSIRKTLLHQGLSGLINELVVTEKYRGKGIGKQLIFVVMERCKQLGCCEVEVSTTMTNTRAKELYLSCGFEERGLLFEVDLSLKKKE